MRRSSIVLIFPVLFVVGCLSDPEPVRLDGGVGFCADAALCNVEVYPCAPYGNGMCDTLADLRFVPANAHADLLAGGDDVLSMSDIYADETVVGILLFGTAGWCPACRIEARDLNRLYADFQNIDGAGHRLEFVTVVFQDTNFLPADREFAEAYNGEYDFDFSTVADPPGHILDLFDAQSAPGNILIDATIMRIHEVIQGYDEARLTNALRELDGSAVCR